LEIDLLSDNLASGKWVLQVLECWGRAVLAAAAVHRGFVWELRSTLEKYPHIGKVVPAMGYSEQQVSKVPWRAWRIVQKCNFHLTTWQAKFGCFGDWSAGGCSVLAAVAAAAAAPASNGLLRAAGESALASDA
jgi:hypothetical protein